ncbi:hypothetical protein ACQY0O_006882 [Thecaphora frezii]
MTGLHLPQPRISDPRQIHLLLRPPPDSSSHQHVVDHLSAVLPKLAASHPSRPFSPLPSSEALRAHLESLKDAQRQAQQETIDAETNLRRRLVASLTSVKALRQRLDQLPDAIATTEDELLDLCEKLVARSSAPDAESSCDAARTLLGRLERLQGAIEQLKQAKAYFSLLSKAEDLRLAIIKQQNDDAADAAAEHSALDLLAQLQQHVQSCEKLAGEDASRIKAVAFLQAQRDATFASIRKARIARLQAALAQSNRQPEAPARTAEKDDDYFTADVAVPAEGGFAKDEGVRKAWCDLCEFQNTAERLGLMPRATAKPPKRGQPTTSAPKDGKRIAAGSDEYVPLLATQVFVEPLLLRFRYHFDGTRSTNRLDKPEWYLSHVASLIRSQAAVFLPPVRGVPGSGGPIARLCRFYANGGEPEDGVRRAYRYIDTYAELLHGLLMPLRRKLASSMPSLLEHPSLLAHTVFQALTFDADLGEQFPASLTVLRNAGTAKLADDILANQEWFTRWLEGEKEFALRRFEDVVNAPDAWAIGASDSIAEDDEHIVSALVASEAGGGAAADDVSSKTTKSARAVIEILESVTERYRPLPSLAQRLSFLAVVQLPILRAYHQRLSKSLDAFESLSSAFARAMPGEISAGIGAAAGVSAGSTDSDMVRGLRGLGRLIKAMLSASYICDELERWAETAFFVEMSEDLQGTEEGQKLALGLKRDDAAEEDRELDAASLGMLLRRGLKRGATNVRQPAAVAPSGAEGGRARLDGQPFDDASRYGVWAELRRKFGEVVARSAIGVEKLVISEVLEQLRLYSLRNWDTDRPQPTADEARADGVGKVENADGGDGDHAAAADDEDGQIPTPSLIPCLSLLSTHLSHLVAILEPARSVPIYRHIATAISTAVVERVVMAGGSHRFTHLGAQRFRSDVDQGWLSVVQTIAHTPHCAGRLGRKPEAPWKVLRDVASILALPTTVTSSEASGKDGWTLAKATRAAFDHDGEEFKRMAEELGIDTEMLGKGRVAEVVRRRVECWR